MTSVLRQVGAQTISNTSSSQPTVTDIENKIRAEVWKRQIRMKTFFEDYDKLRKGYCVDDKFISGLAVALNILCITLTQAEVRILTDKYRISPGDLILYSQFVENIDKQFLDYSLAKSNLQSLKGNSAVAAQEEDTLAQLINYIKWMISSKRILIKGPLQDYDLAKSSFITRDQFLRVLDNLGLIRNEQLGDLLCRKYSRSTNPKEINYIDFINDVENIKQIEAKVVKGIVPNQKIPQPNAGVLKDIHNDSITEEFYAVRKLPQKLQPIADVLRRVQAEVALRRIRIREFFLDFDGLRKNIVSGEQFKRVLHTLGLSLSLREYQQILKVYRVDPEPIKEERIRWMDFCDDVDLVFTMKGLERKPLQRIAQIDKTVFEPVKSLSMEFTSQQQEIVQELLKGYQSAIQHKRVHLKPMFEDFDITKIGYVTKNQFTRILKQFDFVPKCDRHFNLLLKRYMDRGNVDEVNYYQFIRDVDLYNQQAKLISSTHADHFKDYEPKPKVNKAYITNGVPDDLEDLLGRLRRKVKEQRIRVAEFMKDFDKLRHGNISKDQFRLAMGMAKIPLSESQFTLILNHYQLPEKSNHIRWKQFCQDIDTVFALKELEKTSPNMATSLATTNFKYGREPITPEEEEIANRIKAAFKQFQLANRLDTKQLFANWDKLNRCKVSPKQFRQVLATVGFSLSEQQNRCICKMYISDEGEEVKYLEFLKDTKPFDFSYMTHVTEIVKKGTGVKRKLPEDIESILLELRRTTKINWLRYREYFKDFDPLNKGKIKSNKFKSVVYQTMKVPLEEKLFNVIEAHYLDADPTMVDYERFCDDLNIVFNLPDKHKDPLVRPPNFDYTIVHGKKEEQDINALMRRLGEVVRKHGLLVKPFFQDKDIPKIGRVSFTRMRSILDNNKIPLNDHQYSLLCQNFAYDTDEFNYLDFVDALSQYEAES